MTLHWLKFSKEKTCSVYSNIILSSFHLFIYQQFVLSELFKNISTVKTLDQILEPVNILLDEEDGGTSSYQIRFDESQLYPIPYFPGHKFEIDLRPYSNKFK